MGYFNNISPCSLGKTRQKIRAEAFVVVLEGKSARIHKKERLRDSLCFARHFLDSREKNRDICAKRNIKNKAHYK